MRVAATNYNQFAMVFFKKVSSNREYFKTTLYGGSSPPRPVPQWDPAPAHFPGRGVARPHPAPKVSSSAIAAPSPKEARGREPPEGST